MKLTKADAKTLYIAGISKPNYPVPATLHNASVATGFRIRFDYLYGNAKPWAQQVAEAKAKLR